LFSGAVDHFIGVFQAAIAESMKHLLSLALSGQKPPAESFVPLNSNSPPPQSKGKFAF
jgi:hypothetical protein